MVLPVWLPMLAQALQQQEAAERARREARANIYAQSASSLGAPTYGYQAAKTQQQLDEERRRNMLGMIGAMPGMFGGGGGGNGGMMGGAAGGGGLTYPGG